MQPKRVLRSNYRVANGRISTFGDSRYVGGLIAIA